jgi:hypothetical protein
MRGGLRLRLLEVKGGYSGVVVSDGKGRLAEIKGSDPVELWQRLEIAAAQAGNEYLGWDGARARFLRFFPGGFASKRYRSEERDYKISAKKILDAGAPLERAQTEAGLGKVVLTAFQKTNLLSPFETMRVRDLLHSAAADAFVNAAARFALGEGVQAWVDMAKLAKPFDAVKWPVLTYLPFLWRPDRHMFLKPEVTKGFAERVGHPFVHAYGASPEIGVYETLLDLVARTETEIAAFHPVDRIDVQSFIWVVGAYTEKDAPSAKDAAAEQWEVSEDILRQPAHDRVDVSTDGGSERLTISKNE